MSTAARAPVSRRAGGAGRLSSPVVGVLSRQGRFWTAEPLFEPRGPRVTLDAKARGDAREGDVVLLAGAKRGPRVVRLLGRPDVARDVLEALMLERGLRRAFPAAVEAEATDAAAGAQAGTHPRRDLTELPTFTIDPVSARDYDDAVSARVEQDGVRVWVHIADVGAHVRPGSALDGEAYRRGTSVYVPATVEPMLPEALSNGACSLRPGEQRMAVTVELLLDGADVRSAAFYRSSIRSDARLTYDQVDRILAGSERAEDPWAGPLAAARSVAAALRERRAARGSLAVESSEPSFELDSGGHVVGVHAQSQAESHSLIEQLMIVANEQVAGYLADRHAPTLYRVHERPDAEAILFLVARLASLEVPTPALPEQLTPQQAGELVGEVSQMVSAHVRRTGRGGEALTSLVLRSLKQAYYSPRNVGHAGLASPRYCHFTSPIRRYPDLVAHRALLAALGLGEAAPPADGLEQAGLDCSAAERAALRLERDADDICLAFLLGRVLAERGRETVWDGEVVGLIGAGAFIRFGDERFEGFLPVRRLRGEWWTLNEEGTALVGERHGGRLRLGDPISVEVARVETARGRVDLVPAEA